MLKYYNAMVVFEEIPDEITLAINITNCPCHCVGCHSKFLWEDVGIELTTDVLDDLLIKNKGITCVCFMGGDADPEGIQYLASYILERCNNLSVAWYSGKDNFYEGIEWELFKYVKIGHYDEKYGSLDKETTNQRLYKVEIENNEKNLIDITSKFWKKR